MIDFPWNQDWVPVLKIFSVRALHVLMVLGLGWLVARFVRRYLFKALDKIPHVDSEFKYFTVSLVYYSIISVVIILTLTEMGVQSSTILTIVGAAGLAIGLALQNTLSNIAAGIMLLLLRPFRIGDEIAVSEIQGIVSLVGLFTTELVTREGVFVSAPNSEIWSHTITNFSRNPTRRFDTPISITYEEDLEKARTAIQKYAYHNSKILKTPTPEVYVTSIQNGEIHLILRAWTHSDTFLITRLECNQGVKDAMIAQGIRLPVPRQEIHLHSRP